MENFDKLEPDNYFWMYNIETFLLSVFVILGHYYEHLGLMIAMEEKKLFKNGEFYCNMRL